MQQHELVNLIREAVGTPAVPHQPAVWADFGAGDGNFTRALRELIGEQATIYAVDRNGAALHSLRRQHDAGHPPDTLHTLTADFTLPLTLPLLDGVLMANALHFVPARDHGYTLKQIAGYLRPGGRLVLVEYDFDRARSYVPHPISSRQFPDLLRAAGWIDPQITATRTSPRSGDTMYAGLAQHPAG